MTVLQFNVETKTLIRRVLERSWSEETSFCYDPDIAPLSYGQCAPTAIVLFEVYGGEILRTNVKKIHGGSVPHFYNRINGERLDFTADQFNIPNYWCELVYNDIPSDVEEACSILWPGQLDAMRAAFKNALEQENAG